MANLYATYLARMGAWLFPSRFLNFRIFRNFRQSSVILPMVAKLIVILICDFRYKFCPNRSLIAIIESAVLFYIFLQSLSEIGGGRPFSIKSVFFCLNHRQNNATLSKIAKNSKIQKSRRQ